MRTFKLKISSLGGDVFDGEAIKLSVRGAEGELAILSDHIPFVTPVIPCDARVELEDETELVWEISDGLLTVRDNQVVLLSGKFSAKE